MLGIIPDGVHRVIDYTCYILPGLYGFQDAHANSQEGLELLVYAPIATKATATSIELGIAGGAGGAVGGGAVSGLPGMAAGGLVGAVTGGTTGLGIGTVTGGARSLLGYWVGRISGEIVKHVTS